MYLEAHEQHVAKKLVNQNFQFSFFNSLEVTMISAPVFTAFDLHFFKNGSLKMKLKKRPTNCGYQNTLMKSSKPMNAKIP